MQFIKRLLKNLGILFGVLLPLQLVGIIVLLPTVFLNHRLVGSLLPTNARELLKLPAFLKWFDSADLYEEFGRDPETYVEKVAPLGWWERYKWLALRNPLNYFGYKVLGYRAKTDIPGSPVGDNTGKEPGLSVIELDDGVYEYYLIYRYADKLCFRFRMGHKLQDTKQGELAQWVFVVQPFKTYDGV